MLHHYLLETYSPHMLHCLKLLKVLQHEVTHRKNTITKWPHVVIIGIQTLI